MPPDPPLCAQEGPTYSSATTSPQMSTTAPMSMPGRRTLTEDYCASEPSTAAATPAADQTWAAGAPAAAGRRTVLDAIAVASLDELDAIRRALLQAFGTGMRAGARPAMVPMHMPPMMDRPPPGDVQVHHNDIPGLMVAVDHRRAELVAQGQTRTPQRTSPTSALDGTAATAEVVSDPRIQFLLERIAAESDPATLHLLSTELTRAQSASTPEVTIVMYGPSRVPTAALPHLVQVTEQRYRQLADQFTHEAAPDPQAAPDLGHTPASPTTSATGTEPAHEDPLGAETHLEGRLPSLRFPEHGTRTVGPLDLYLELGGRYSAGSSIAEPHPAPGHGHGHEHGAPEVSLVGTPHAGSVNVEGWLMSAFPHIAEQVPSWLHADTIEGGIDHGTATLQLGVNMSAFDVQIGATPIHISAQPQLALVQREDEHGAAHWHFGTVSLLCALAVERVPIAGVEYRIAGTLTIGLFALDRWLQRNYQSLLRRLEEQRPPTEAPEAEEMETVEGESLTSEEEASLALEGGDEVVIDGATGEVLSSTLAADEAVGATVAAGAELATIMMVLPAALVIAALVFEAWRLSSDSTRDAARREDELRRAAFERRGDTIAATVRACCLAYQAVLRGEPVPPGAGASAGAQAASDRMRTLTAHYTAQQIHSRAREVDLYRGAFDSLAPEILERIAADAHDLAHGNQAREDEARAIFEQRLWAAR